jgi:hypothetical protein
MRLDPARDELDDPGDLLQGLATLGYVVAGALAVLALIAVALDLVGGAVYALLVRF